MKKLFHNKKNPIIDVFKGKRNETCRCGSGKKYKHCHFHEDEKLILILEDSDKKTAPNKSER